MEILGSIRVSIWAVAVVCLAVWGWRFLNWIWLRPKKLERCLRKQGFAGNPYRLLTGDMKDIATMREQAISSPMNFSHDIAPRVIPSINHTIHKYGKNSFMWVGPYPRVHIMDPDQLKAALSLMHDIQKPTINPLARLLFDGLTNHEGPKWVKHRKIMNPAFHFKHLKDMVPAICESCTEMIRKWEEVVSEEGFYELDVMPHLENLAADVISRTAFGSSYEEGKMIFIRLKQLSGLLDMVPAMCESCTEMIRKWEEVVSKDGYYELDVMPHLGNLAADVISRTAFGSSYEEGKMIFIRLKELINLFVKATSTVYIPGWRFVPTKSNNRMKKISKELKALLLDVINKRQRAMMAGEAMHNDLLSILLQSNLKEIQEHGNNDVGMSIEDIVDECRVFYLAGQETTAMLLVWTMVLLSSYTRWQDLAREEVLQVFGNNKPDFDGLNGLKIVTMILNEVLRLYPPAAVVPRLVQNETKLEKLSFPAGVMLSFPIILIHRDKKLWGDDANEFNPDRFAEGVSKATQNQTGFFPFGWGPRICIGQNFAIIEAKIALSMILQHFSFELSSSYTHAPTSNLTTRPQHGAHIMLCKL